MKKSRYSEEQIVRILREADKHPITDIAKRYGVSEASVYAWRKRFGDMSVSEVKKAIKIRNKLNLKLNIEVSGNVNLGNIRAFAQSGVDVISLGTLTKDVHCLNLSLEIK